MNDVLEPCPFCGSRPRILVVTWGRPTYAYACSNRRCVAYHEKDDYSIGHFCQRDKQSAADAWNRRTK